MQRREFITLLGGAAAAWPLKAGAQQRLLPLIACLTTGQNVAPFRQGLSEAGIVEGQNATLEIRSGSLELLPVLLPDLVARRAAVMYLVGSPAVVAAKATGTTVPIVFTMGEDPVSLGLVASLNRPGGNITGVAYLSSLLVAKRLEQLHDLAPQAAVVAALVNPKTPHAEIGTMVAQDAARKLGLQIHFLHASSADDLDKAFATLAQLMAGALLITPDGVFNANANQIAVLAARYGIPASHEFRIFPDAGGLMSYGASTNEGARLAGAYAGRIVMGEKPADLPVVQPTKFEMVINLKTARALNITVPPTLLVAATHVIE